MEKNMVPLLNQDDKNKDWREKKTYHTTLKASETKADTKS